MPFMSAVALQDSYRHSFWDAAGITRTMARPNTPTWMQLHQLPPSWRSRYLRTAQGGLWWLGALFPALVWSRLPASPPPFLGVSSQKLLGHRVPGLPV